MARTFDDTALLRAALASVAGLAAAGLLGACAGLLGLAGVEEPRVSVDSTRVTGVTFDASDLEVRFRIDNPNDFGLQLAGLDYELEVADRTLFRGDRRERLRLEPQGEGIVALPLTVRYADVYQVARDLLRGRDEVGYTLRAGLRFEAPVVGALRVPVEARGGLPLRR
jgi:LEA14-like dessication related protein